MAVGLYSGVSGLALGIGLYRNVSGLWGGASGLINGFGGADPYAGASLYLNFLNPPLDSRIDFSRGTNATLIDSTGRLTYAPANLMLQSQTFDNAIWARTGTVTITADAGAAPDGTNTADRFVSIGGSFPQMAQSVTIPAGNYVLSLWVRSDGTTQIQQSIIFDGITVDFTPTATWARVQVVKTGSTGGSRSIVIATNSGSAPASSFFLWGAQLEQVTYQTTPGAYNATTASAYYGPRFDYDPVTLAPRGLLIEKQRTNLLTYSQDWTNAAWSKANVTVTAAATTSPDGAVNAQRLQATTTAATNVSSPAIAVAATSASYSVYVKQGSGATTANTFALRNNTTATNLVLGTLNYSTGVWTYTIGSTGVTVANAGNGWWRLQITATSGITSGDTLIVYAGFIGNAQTAGDHLFVYGAQLEAGGFATSYIPTVASTVTRNADNAAMTGTNFSTWYNQSEGTFVLEMSQVAVGEASRFFEATELTYTTRKPLIFMNTSNQCVVQFRDSGVDQAVLGIGSITANTVMKMSAAYKANDFGGTFNGGTPATDNSGIVTAAVDRLFIGSGGSAPADQISCHIRTIAYFNTRLPNAQLQTLTAPSLATTLSLDFTTGSYNVGF